MMVGNDGLTNEAQKKYWSDGPGKQWVERDDVLTRLMHKVTDVLVDRVDPQVGERIIDIGCGSGATTIAFAQRVGIEGQVIGADISEPLLERARLVANETGAGRAEFIFADAQTHAFSEGAFDHLVSRFGVMFFADPVAALANLRKALRPGGRLCFACWGSLAGNPWFYLPRDAAVARLGKPAQTAPNMPGPLGFADETYVLRILRDAGFSDCRADLAAIELCPPNSIDEVAALATGLGPAMRILQELGGDIADRTAIVAGIAESMAQYQTPEGIRVPAEIWYYTAVND